ncbi:nitrite reductase small subunit NirD [Pseudarthrobacter sp. P1]|uniref:nitrite reductase small subunit NirD n=1 Tax=Pseudarthrobacter sp. P1 TaxID=3418418 RepID=UPI003CF1A12C
MTAVIERRGTDPATDPAGAGATTTLAWHRICPLAELEELWGEAALVAGRQIALFRVDAATVFAVDQADPAADDACVMARGIVGSRGAHRTISSPLHKEVYALETGECLSGPGPALPAHPARVVDGFVEVAL